MVLRSGKYGQFWGCSGYPRCRNTKPFNGNGKPKADVVDAKPEKPFVPSKYQEAVFEAIAHGQGHTS
jgi:ssDNA-binding Zn-finger/Zn-ribbon topoisomerase 1